MNLHAWLNQITDAQMPDSNWNYFAIMVQLGFKRAVIAKRLRSGEPWPAGIEVLEARSLREALAKALLENSDL